MQDIIFGKENSLEPTRLVQFFSLSIVDKTVGVCFSEMSGFVDVVPRGSPEG